MNFWGILVVIFFIMIIYILNKYNIYRKNKSKIKFDLNKESDVNFEEKYNNLYKKHNEIYKQTKKILNMFILMSIPTLIFATLGVRAFYTGSNYAIVYSGVFALLFILTVTLVATKVIKNNKNVESVQKYYHKTIINMMIRILNCKQSPSFSIAKNEMNILKKNEDEIQKYYKFENDVLKDIFIKTGRKYYKEFEVLFNYTAYINNKCVNIKRISNCNYRKGYVDPEDGRYYAPYYICSFIGYIITLPEFTNKELLINLPNKDYCYDEDKKVLIIIVSDQIRSRFMINDFTERFYAKLHKKFEKEQFLKKNYNYYNQLAEYIKQFCI